MVLLCHVTFQDHVIKALNDLIVRMEPLKICHHLSKFGDNARYGSGDIIVLTYHVIPQDHEMQGLCDFIGRNLSGQVTVLPSLVAIGTLVVEI